MLSCFLPLISFLLPLGILSPWLVPSPALEQEGGKTSDSCQLSHWINTEKTRVGHDLATEQKHNN